MKIHIPKKFKILKKVKFSVRHLIDFEKKFLNYIVEEK